MPITDNDFSKVAHILIKQIQNPKKPLTKDSFEYTLYKLLTQKHFDADLYNQEFRHYKNEFYKSQDNISLKPYGTTDRNPAWFSLSPVRGDSRFEEKEQINGFSVSHKRYYSLLLPQGPSHEVVDYIIRFCKSLPELFMKIYKLAYDSHSKISLKVPGTLSGFISHHDTIVVHFRNKHLSDDIHNIVLNHLKKHGFHYKRRMHRVDKGFDFKDDIIKDGSHSRLIAKMLSDHLFKHKDSLATANETNIAQWLKNCLKAINTWSPEEFAKKLRSL